MRREKEREEKEGRERGKDSKRVEGEKRRERNFSQYLIVTPSKQISLDKCTCNNPNFFHFFYLTSTPKLINICKVKLLIKK